MRTRPVSASTDATTPLAPISQNGGIAWNSPCRRTAPTPMISPPAPKNALIASANATPSPASSATRCLASAQAAISERPTSAVVRLAPVVRS